MGKPVTVKKAAELTGLSVKAIRYYERIGLLPCVDRSESGYRLYTPEDLERLRRLRFYRALKFPAQEIAALIDAPSELRRERLLDQLDRVRHELVEYGQAVELLQSAIAAEDERKRRAVDARRSHIAIVGIDLQNDMTEGGALPCRRIGAIVPRLKALYAEARARGVPVIYVCDCHHKGVDEELRIWGDHCIEGTWGAAVIGELKPEPQDYVVKKGCFNGFVRTSLQSILEGLGADTIIFTGWRSDVCVAQTAVEAFYRGFRVVVASDGVDSTTKAEHEVGLRLLQINYDFEMYPCATVLDDVPRAAKKRT